MLSKNTKLKKVLLLLKWLYNNNSYATNLYTFANNIHTHEGGMHEDGFKLAINREMRRYADDNEMLKKDEALLEMTL